MLIMDSRSLLPIGTKLQMGKYRVDRYLSSGSFGNTYVITNLQFGEQYAMKEFFMKGVNEREKNHTTICVSNNVNYERYEQQREKFKKEARRLRQLNNKHLVRVYDLFDENGTTYYVMDLIHGQTMLDAMEETGRTYTESQAINVVCQILEALDALHQQGIWHLDLKPANIMIDNQGLVKVIDFGASKQMNANFEYTSTSAAICYTPGYAPTEQVDQNISRIGPWTDLYALGATLYFMLTGSQPPSSSEILDGYAFQFNTSVSKEMQKLIVWLMKPNRNERPQTVSEVFNIIYQLPSQKQEKTKSKRKDTQPKERWRIAFIAASFAGLLTIFILGYKLLSLTELQQTKDKELVMNSSQRQNETLKYNLVDAVDNSADAKLDNTNTQDNTVIVQGDIAKAENAETEEMEISELVRKWDNYHKLGNEHLLRSLYADNVLFYGMNLPRQDAINKITEFLEKSPFSQFSENLRFTYINSETIRCSFDKIVEQNEGTKMYPSYLTFRKHSGFWYIIEESDEVTDRNLARMKKKMS